MIEPLLEVIGIYVEPNLLNRWIVLLLEASILGAAIVAIGFVIERLLRQKVSHRFLYCMWLLVLLRFAMVWTPESPTSVLNLLDSAHSNQVAVTSTSTHLDLITAELNFVTSSQESFHASPTTATLPNPSPAPFQISTFSVVTIVWLFGCSFLLVRLGIDWTKIRRIISSATNDASQTPALLKRCEELRIKFGIHRKVRIRVSDQISTPATTGIMRPTILLPQQCVEQLTSEEMGFVLAHELTHIWRNDGMFQLVGWLIGAFHWFNPMAHFAVRRIAKQRELSCDQAVLKMCDTKASRKLYGQTILKIAEMQINKSCLPCVMAHGFVGSNRNLITQRIDMIIKPKKTTQIANFIGALLILVTVAIGFTAAQELTPPKPKAVDPPTQETSAEQPAVPERADENDKIRDEALTFEPELWRDLEVTRKALAKGKRSTLGLHVPIEMTAGTKRVIKFDKDIPELICYKPEIAEFTPLAPREIAFEAMKPGVCQLTLTYSDKSKETIGVFVNRDTSELEKALSKKFPNEKVFVSSYLDVVSLRGHIPDQAKAEEMIEFAESYIDDTVTTENFGLLISYRLQIYEISMKKFESLAIASKTKPSELLFVEGEEFLPSGDSIHVGFHNGDKHEKTLNALVRQDLLTLVDQPVLVSHSGGSANFFSGREMRFLPGTPNWKQAKIGKFYRLQAHYVKDETLTLEMNVRLPKTDPLLSARDGSPTLRTPNIQTVKKMKFGETIMLLLEPSTVGPNSKATLTLVTPEKVPKTKDE